MIPTIAVDRVKKGEPRRASPVPLIGFLLLFLPSSSVHARELEVVDKLVVQGGMEASTSATAGPLIFISSGISPGNVGIGTTSPATKLHVQGVIEAVEIACPTCTGTQRRITGSCPAGQGIQTINVDGSVVCEIGVPNPLIVISTSTCPSGYGELPSFYGRFITGMPSGGTIAGTVGSTLADLANLSHNHTFTGTAANLDNTDISHTHTVDPPNTASGGPTASACRYFSSSDDGGGTDVGDNAHTHATDIGVVTSAGASVSQNHNHAYTPAGTVDTIATTPPHIQVRFCMKL